MRALLIVDTSKDIEFSLLRDEIIGDWSVRFEREVQALQTAILLRLTWLDSFEANMPTKPDSLYRVNIVSMTGCASLAVAPTY